MRLIDADALLSEWAENPPSYGMGNVINSVKNFPTVSGWISVNDRLPELHIAVLGYAPYRKNIWAVTMHDDQSWYIWQPSLSKKYEPEWDGPITHWMPLPSTEGLHET